jgi:hypothetical protein
VRLFILIGLVVGVIAVFALDEGARLTRSGWLRLGIDREIAHSVFRHRRW